MDSVELVLGSARNDWHSVKQTDEDQLMEQPSTVDSQPTRSCDSPRGVDGLNVRKIKRTSRADLSLDSMDALNLQNFRQQPVLEATRLIQAIKAKEKDIEIQPTIELISEIMDFYRQAIERFEEADDIRHEQVVLAMRTFLSKPVIARILNYDCEARGTTAWKEEGPVPEGEILIPTKDQLEADDDSVTVLDCKDSFENDIDSFLDDAERAFRQFQHVLESDVTDSHSANSDIPTLTSLPLPNSEESVH